MSPRGPPADRRAGYAPGAQEVSRQRDGRIWPPSRCWRTRSAAIGPGRRKCPEKEADIYEKYAERASNSPKAAEACYNAAYRWAAVMTIYTGEGQSNKVPEAKKRAEAAAQKVIDKNASPEWNANAERLLYMMRNNIPVYGTSLE